jgi:hypothetical protein
VPVTLKEVKEIRGAYSCSGVDNKSIEVGIIPSNEGLALPIFDCASRAHRPAKFLVPDGYPTSLQM